MKKNLHPDNYRPVVFQDINNNQTFLTKSTAPSDETISLDGVDYPLVKIHISSASHPFYTGQEKLLDIEGRVDKFKARRQAAQDRAAAMKNKTQKMRSKNNKTESQKIGAAKTASN